ncbi:hypothetical protein KVR01_007458 [Diaporthe batatas]|uniref:uncharacterized protein n=1 Tax=Diaporthe batatas TaxID=748121 RepID=UPI001D05A995|nr:uncharacterized protein KVR01_007458 [Diaporthe batatas]KAG8162980.1 hypothetical protein KVR01_007458 [Diaporthe batatas]
MTSTITPTPIEKNSQSGPKADSISLETTLRLPNTSELLTHLNLLDAIVCLKASVDEYGEMNGMDPGKAWDQFCQAAAAKFLQWSESVDVSKASVATPSLNILMIWHSYMLNTKDYVQFQNEAFRGRMAGKGIDWKDLQRKLALDYIGMADILDALDGSQEPGTEKPKTLLTAPNNFDMVAAVQRQLKFAEKVYEAEWRRPKTLHDFLDSAVARYKEFFALIAENPGVCIAPTLAIDLVWHTHQLSPKRYRSYCRHVTDGRFVHHDDNLDESTLEQASNNAEELYFSKYGVAYNHSIFSTDKKRPMCFGDIASRTCLGGKDTLMCKATDAPSCSSRCGSSCSSACGSSCSTACRSGCQSYCRGGLCANQCRAACGYVCGACETKSD